MVFYDEGVEFLCPPGTEFYILRSIQPQLPLTAVRPYRCVSVFHHIRKPQSHSREHRR